MTDLARSIALAEAWADDLESTDHEAIRTVLADPVDGAAFRRELHVIGALRAVHAAHDEEADVRAFRARWAASGQTARHLKDLRRRQAARRKPRALAPSFLWCAAAIAAIIAVMLLVRPPPATALQSGERIVGGEAGVRGVDLGNGVVADADPGSVVTVLSEAPHRRFRVEHGRLTLSVAPLRAGDELSVDAGSLTAHVRGTRFSTSWDGSRAEVAVEHGLVDVWQQGRAVARVNAATSAQSDADGLRLTSTEEKPQTLFAPDPAAIADRTFARDGITVAGKTWIGRIVKPGVMAVDFTSDHGLAQLPDDGVIAFSVRSDRPRMWYGLYIRCADGWESTREQQALPAGLWVRMVVPVRSLSAHRGYVVDAQGIGRLVHVRLQADPADGGELLIRDLRLSGNSR